MKPTFDSREITRRFRIERSERAAVIRLYVEAQHKKNGQRYWRKVWTSGQHKGDLSYAMLREVLQLDGLFNALDLDAGDVILSEPLHRRVASGNLV